MTSKKKAIVFFVIRSHKNRLRQTKNLNELPGYTKQTHAAKSTLHYYNLDALSAYTDRCPDKSANIFIRPKFQEALSKASEEGAIFVIHDIFNLFSHLKDQEFKDTWNSLVDRDVVIIDCCLNISINKLPFTMAKALRFARLGARLSKAKTAPRNVPSSKAIKASAISRQMEAKKFAAKLYAIISSIEAKADEAGHKATLAHIASELNAKGITTRHGNKWTPTAVSRVKKTIDELVALKEARNLAGS